MLFKFPKKTKGGDFLSWPDNHETETGHQGRTEHFANISCLSCWKRQLGRETPTGNRIAKFSFSINIAHEIKKCNLEHVLSYSSLLSKN